MVPMMMESHNLRQMEMDVHAAALEQLRLAGAPGAHALSSAAPYISAASQSHAYDQHQQFQQQHAQPQQQHQQQPYVQHLEARFTALHLSSSGE